MQRSGKKIKKERKEKPLLISKIWEGLKGAQMKFKMRFKHTHTHIQETWHGTMAARTLHIDQDVDEAN